jgi:hypothetical protein
MYWTLVGFRTMLRRGTGRSVGLRDFQFRIRHTESFAVIGSTKRGVSAALIV